MISGSLLAWPVLGSLAGGIGAVVLAWALRAYRDEPGVDWFLGVFAAQAVWCFSYGIGLAVSDLTLRIVLETTAWFGIVWTGIAFLGFALEYTGRGDVIHGRLFGIVVAFGLLSTALLITNSVHGAYWTSFRIDPVFGVSTASYAFGPWAYLVIAVELIAVASAVFLLVDTLLSYGPLYWRESAAVALSPLAPGFALVAWILAIGPVPQLQLAPLMFVPHVALDGYAFARAEMFERNPTTSRAAERTAIDDLTDPIVALALDGRIVRLNPAAESLLGVTASTDVRDTALSEFLDVTVAVDGGTEELTVGSARGRRTYSVSTSPLTDSTGSHVGYTVVFSDVTDRERRRQQLAVLNRILRHNLRNDAGVARGYGELLVERLDDPDLRRMADAIERRAGALAALGAKAGTVEALSTDATPVAVDVENVVETVVADARHRYPDATVDATVDAGSAVVELRRTAVRAIVENTVDNALEHHDDAGVEREDGGPWVRVELVRADDALVLTVADDGPGIPDHEIAAVESGRETSLEHGSGIGLWIVEWAAVALGAAVDYADREPRGTSVTVRIPVTTEIDGEEKRTRGSSVEPR
ncbi:histidine kinase N-terminal 7TM domain-containing protein [Halorubrum sp. DTA98]|uniref:histidine kinase N-terminal 7TM domain-containing protein n=1 Tax=Halorubrum sp. DTA98 TaxID=3402163 RepID=UPI003AAA407C